MKNKKNIKILSLILSIIAIIAIGTYAWLTWSSQNNTELSTTIDNILEVEFTTGPDINATNLGPVLEPLTDGEITTFSVRNKANYDFAIDINLAITSIANELKSESFKYMILSSDTENGQYNNIASNGFDNMIVGDNTIGMEIIPKKSTKYFKFIVYIDGSMNNNTNLMRKTLSGKLNVTAHEYEPNPPELVQGLIPVRYEETMCSEIANPTYQDNPECYDYYLSSEDKEKLITFLIDKYDYMDREEIENEIENDPNEKLLRYIEYYNEDNDPDIIRNTKFNPNNAAGGKWVKADSTNANHNWYNYKDKKWANAVLVRETGYSENLNQENKTVSIDNTPIAVVDKYTSSNQGIANTTSETTFTFTTGSSTGTISFDYTVSSETYDKFSVTLKKEGSTSTEVFYIDNIGGTIYTSHSSSTDANTSYVLTVRYNKNYSTDSLDDEATISNIQISNLSGNITVAASGDYGWTRSDRYVYPITSYTTYSHYDDGSYALTIGNAVNKSLENSVGNYICSDATSTTCTTLYKIKSYNGNTITAVDEYNNSSFTARSDYQSANIGTEIKEDAILAYYVWIPRYKYKVWNINKVIDVDSYNALTVGIDIVFENETATTGTIKCNYDFTVSNDNRLSETCTGNNNDYYTHPAFTFGNTELTGIWVGKFEISSETPNVQTTESNGSYIREGQYYGGGNVTNLTVRVKPNVRSWVHNTITNFYKVIYDMQKTSNIYGLSTDRTNTDSHMLKNMEWGAIAYLTNSKYGRCTNNTCTKVRRNDSIITGNALSTAYSSQTAETCNAYNTTVGKLASTTGNIYGIYDMSGEIGEYVMGNVSAETGVYTYNEQGAGSNYTYTGYEKYINTYAYGMTDSGQNASYNRSRLGDAIGESGYPLYISSFTPLSSWLTRNYNSYDSNVIFSFYMDFGYPEFNYPSRSALISISN